MRDRSYEYDLCSCGERKRKISKRCLRCWIESRRASRRNVYRRVGRKSREHRLIMEAIIGRPLAPGEVVHHKNGIRSDNRPENLEVMTASEHGRLHALEYWHGRAP